LNPKNAVDVVFNGLADFINAAMEEDKQFAVFPYSLSEYNVADELPLVINNVEMLPEEVEDWLQYFPDAKPCRQGGDIYITILIGLSMPFPKFIKKLSPWCHEKKYGLWPSSLQSEKPVSLGWLLFLTNIMDTELLKVAVSAAIYNVLVGLGWKMIHLGMQGKVKPEDQIKALHVYMDEADLTMAKPLVMTVYPSKPGENHTFPMGIRMRLVPEIDMVLNQEGRKMLKNCRPVKTHGQWQN